MRQGRPIPKSVYVGKDGMRYLVESVDEEPGIAPDEYRVTLASEQQLRNGSKRVPMTDVEFEAFFVEQGLALVTTTD